MAHQTVRNWDGELVPSAAGRTDRPSPACPVETALAAIAGRWTTLVLRDLMDGPLSYGELRAALPSISDKVLTERLAALCERGLVRRERRPAFPARVTYDLTDAGRLLRPLLIELYRTGERLLSPDE
ncbi:winged helix-turn-helix transcriptional regulator [Amycolatopsis lexingtonensis]|uniref:winged helix-turn-helix transcriptional regulator n=1 Tax=Amycolatopsis lexingtonensis TaxID=218822 RepID=UPI003F6EE19A